MNPFYCSRRYSKAMMSASILSLVYRSKLKEYNDRLAELKDPKVVYVTDLVACSNKRFFRLQFPELTFRFEPILILGDLIHKGLELFLTSEGYEVEKEVEEKYSVKGLDYVLKGRIDAFNARDSVVIEVKFSRTSQGVPHEHHVLQLQVYLNLLKAENGTLIYVTPDRILEYQVKSQPIDIEALIKETVENSVHPRWSWECKYCYFNRMCPYKKEEELSKEAT